MVREGKTAKPIACKEAEVKKPISGRFQVPTEEVLSGTMARVRKVKQAKVIFPVGYHVQRDNGTFVQAEDGNGKAKKVVLAHVENGEGKAKKAVSPRVEDGEARTRKVFLAHVEDGEARTRKVSLAHVEDGEARAGKVSLAHVEDGEAGVRKVVSQGRALQALPEMANEKSSIVQQRQTQMAYSDLTLSQLFAIKG